MLGGRAWEPRWTPMGLEVCGYARTAQMQLAEQAERARIKDVDREEQAALSAHRGKTYRAPNRDRWTVEDAFALTLTAIGDPCHTQRHQLSGR